jgi:hypothetical protein
VTLSEAARQQVEAFEADLRSGRAANQGSIAQGKARAHLRQSADEALLIGVGVTIWTDPERHRGADDPVAQEDGSLSGVVLEVLAGYEYTDEGGEIKVVPTRYRVANFYAARNDPRRFAVWPAEWVDIWRTEATPMPKLAQHWRRLCGMLAEKSSLPTTEDARIFEDAHRLLRILMSEGGRR